MALIFRNKKGSGIIEPIFIAVVLLAMSFTLLFVANILNDIKEDIEDDPGMAQAAKDVAATAIPQYSQVWDGAFAFLFVMLWILILVAAFKIDSHPIFFIISVIGLIFVMPSIAYFANLNYEISTDADMQATTDTFPKMNWIMTHLVELIIIAAFSVVVMLYGVRAGWFDRFGGATF